MSVNSLPKKLRLKPVELYLLIQFDHMLWKLCDIFEGAWHELAKCPAKRLKATSNVWLDLVSGSTRAEMVKDIVELDYEESYAEKFVDKMIKKYRRLLKGSGVFHIKVKSEPIKGQFGKPYSRRRRSGRPTSKYKLEEHSKVKPNKRMEKLPFLAILLSGSLVRFLKLCMRMMCEEPKMREVLLGAAKKIFPVPLNELEESFQEIMVKGREDLEKYIDEWYSKLMEPVWKELPSILGLELEGQVKTAHC